MRADNTVSVLLGNGDGTFSPAQRIAVHGWLTPQGIAVADFNGDGFADLAVTNFGEQHEVRCAAGKRQRHFQPQEPLSVGRRTAPAASR